MHPFHSEMRARELRIDRHREADARRLVAQVRPAWSDRTGTLLVEFGEQVARAGRRLQASRRAPAAPCLEGC